MLNDRSTPLSLLKTRRSARPRDLVEPGPADTEIEEIITIAARTPDHGKLHPWRFLHVPSAARTDFAAMLKSAYWEENPDPSRLEIEAVDRFARQAPTLIVALSAPVESPRIPEWEQLLSCGAACMNLVHAAHALGYAAGWVTGWPTYSAAVRKQIAEPHERIAGFIFIGSALQELQERPRPTLGEILSVWRPKGATA